LTLELQDFVQAVRDHQSPRVTGLDALRSMRLADRILLSLRQHAWEGRPDGPIGPGGFDGPHPAIPAPKSWRHRQSRRATNSLPPEESGSSIHG
jgi:hypothetical protein